MIKSTFKTLTKTARKKLINVSAVVVLAVSGLGIGVIPLLATGSASALGATLYVSNTGSDTNCDGTTADADTGTPGSQCAFATIPAAITAATAGDTISVAAGNYTGNDIDVSKSVTLNGAPGAVVTVPDVSGTNGFDVHANDVTINGFTINGPATSSYLTYAWGGTVTRGIFIYNGVANFNITNNTIQNLRNDILIDGRNTGSVTGNVIDNSKSGISVQYTDAGTGNTEGYNIDISGNSEGIYGNEWGLNMHLNGHDAGGGVLVGNAVKIAPTAPTPVQTALLANKAANGGWSVQDQGYSFANRTSVTVASTGSDANQGSPLGPLATIQAGVNAVVANGGVVNVKNGSYSGGVNIDKSGITLTGESQAGVQVTATSATPFGQGVSVNAVSDVSISDMTFNAPAGSPISYAFQAYQSSNLTLTNLTFNGPGKSTTPKIGGVDFNSVQNVTLNNVTASNYAKNGFSFTAKYTAGDTASSNITLNGVTADNNNWAGIAFYNANSSGTVGADMTGVVFSGVNTFTNNAQGLFVEGDTDANFALNAAPRWGILGAGGSHLVDINGITFSGNVADVVNYQKYLLDNSNSAPGAPSVDVPSDVNVTVDSGTWDGVINPPTIESISVPLPSGATQGVVVKVGSDTASLLLDKAARLTFPGQTGKLVGYIHNGNFVAISNVCAADDQATNDANLPAGGDCYMYVGGDLVVWTKHFTTFVTYSPAAPVGGGSGGSSSTGSSSTGSTGGTNTVTNTTTPAYIAYASDGTAAQTGSEPQVAGASTTESNSRSGSYNGSRSTKDTKNSGFLGLGWYWFIPLGVIALAVAGYYGYKKRNADA